MNDINDLYKAPRANLEQEVPIQTTHQLASRGDRLMAAIIDGIISILISLPLLYFAGFWEMLEQSRQPPMATTAMIGIGGMILFVLLHGYFLKNHGQTIGKIAVKIYIVDLNNRVPDFTKLISLRYLPMWIVSLIPVIGSILPLVDVLFVFRKDRRCVHDLLAGTKVITKRE